MEKSDLQKKLSQSDKDFMNDMLDKIIQSFIKQGLLTVTDLEDQDELWKKIKQLNEEREYLAVIEYKDNLISNARKFYKSGEVDNAKFLYATLFEHTMNEIINESCIRKNIIKKEINTIIRAVNLEGKLTWLTRLLEIPQVSIKHKKIIMKLASDRNAYIHYKYNPESNDEIEDYKEKEEIAQIEKTVIYFKKYSSRILYNNQKTIIDNHLRSRRDEQT